MYRCDDNNNNSVIENGGIFSLTDPSHRELHHGNRQPPLQIVWLLFRFA